METLMDIIYCFSFRPLKYIENRFSRIEFHQALCHIGQTKDKVNYRGR